MKFHLVGVKRIVGVAKASGAPFDMCRAYCLVPIEKAQGKTSVTGYGFELAELELDAAALPQFAAFSLPADVELDVEQKFLFGEFRSIVVGVSAPVPVPVGARVKAA
jgi:hypothetical protein